MFHFLEFDGISPRKSLDNSGADSDVRTSISVSPPSAVGCPRRLNGLVGIPHIPGPGAFEKRSGDGPLCIIPYPPESISLIP